MKNSETRLSFGEFTLDLQRRALLRGDDRVHLTAKPFEALVFLVEHRGAVVSKDALLSAVWKDTAVTEGVLVQAIRQIRRALDDDKEDPVFVQTVPREGYRFIAEVRIHPAVEPQSADVASPPAPSRSWLQMTVAVVAVVALGLLIWRPFSNERAPDRALAKESREAAVSLSPLTAAGVSAVKPVFTPDGRAILYVADPPDAPGVHDLFLQPLNGGEPLRLTHAANASGDLPVFTADGREVVFSRYRSGADGSRVPDLWKVPALGGAHTRYLSDASGAGFSPDGRSVAYTRTVNNDRSLVVSPVQDPGNGRVISTPGFTPRWSPDGRWIAYTTSYPEGGTGDLWIVSASLTAPRRLTREPYQIYGLCWTADSESIVFAARIGNAYHLQRASVASGAIESLTSGVGDYSAPTVSPDGRQVAFAHLRPVRDLLLARPMETLQLVTLTSNESHRWARVSPSGRLIATVAQRGSAEHHVHVTNAQTKEIRRVSRLPAEYPSWISDGALAYLTSAQGESEIRRVDLDTGEDRSIGRLGRPASWLAMRPGATEAAFVVASGDRREIVLRDLASGRESILADGPALEALRWRPDGRELAWSGPRVWADRQANGIWIATPGGAGPRHVIADGYGPAWSDAATMVFVRHLSENGDAGIWRVSLKDGVETQIRHLSRVDFLDVAAGSLVFARSTGRAQVFSMPFR